MLIKTSHSDIEKQQIRQILIKDNDFKETSLSDTEESMCVECCWGRGGLGGNNFDAFIQTSFSPKKLSVNFELIQK